MGTDAYKIHHANKANKEFAEFATNQQKLIEWVNQQSIQTGKVLPKTWRINL